MLYVICPANVKTGGTELLHQLVYELNKNDINAKITYLAGKNQGVGIPDAFRKYVQDFLFIEDIIDSNNNTIVVPETSTDILNKYKNMTAYIWWLSVDHYMWRNVYDPIWHFQIFKTEYGIVHELFCIVKRAIQYRNSEVRPLPIKLMNKNWNHLVQSFYAKDFLEQHSVSNIRWLSDYINTKYLDESQMLNIAMKENCVAYNPNKGMKFTKKLIKCCKDVRFVPIVNMSDDEVIDCLKKSKIYIDFGRHPGKDRIPREAACLHCCVITGVRGAAAYDDVLIDREFKIEDKKKNINKIYSLIENIFSNYDVYDKKYDKYREQVKAEKALFEKNVKEIFGGRRAT